MDAQANATLGLGLPKDATPSVYDVLCGSATLEEAIRPTGVEHLALVPSKPELAGAVVELAQRADGERYLAQSLASGSSQYSFVFLDCPPSLGPLTVNALAAADRVLVPVQAEYYALEGLTQLVHPTAFANLDLVPAKPDLAGPAVELSGHTDGERYLAESLASGSDRYDFVFLDCPPSLGPLTVNALAAANRVLVPVHAEYYALEGLAQLLQSVELIRRRLNPQLGIGGILLTMVDGRTRLAAQVEEEVRRHFGQLVFRTSVPRSVRLAEAPSYGLPAIAYDRRSAGADAYWKVAMELVERA